MSSIGALRDRVTLQSVTYASSVTSAQGVASFTTLATVWANVNALAGSERLGAGAVTSNVTYEIEIKHRTDVTPAMRVLWTPYRGSAKTFEVHAVQISTTHKDRIVLECGVTE